MGFFKCTLLNDHGENETFELNCEHFDHVDFLLSAVYHQKYNIAHLIQPIRFDIIDKRKFSSLFCNFPTVVGVAELCIFYVRCSIRIFQ